MSDVSPPVFGDRYQMVRHIARGGMAQVYLGRDLMLDRLVALKVLFPELSVDRKFVERFRREARAAANLTHPNIVSIYDWGQGEHTYYIVMEYVDGHTLSTRIRQGPIPAREAATIASSVAAALSFAHRRDVIHRDVKPGNVLIDQAGQVKVTDFGIARAVGTTDNLTQAGSVMGTATYFSPEQAQGQTVDARSDVYSLGVVLYEMCVGHAPFQGDNPVAIAYKHVREEPDAPTTRNPAIPAAYEAIVLKAMAKNPADRYQTADELRADLDRFRTGQPVRALGERGSGSAAGLAGATTVLAADRTAVAGPPTQAHPAVDRTTVMAGGAVPPTGLSRAGRGPEDPMPPGPGDGDNQESHAVRWVSLLVILLAALAVAVFFVGRHEGWFDSGTKTINVPSVAGKTEARARTILASDGFTNVQSTDVSSATVPSGDVVATKPGAGSSLAPSARLVLDVSAGPPQIAIAPVSGKPVAAALKILAAQGFKTTVTHQKSTVPIGDVISTSPAAGVKEAKGTPVTVVVSSGPAPVTVPKVAGDSQVQATEALGARNFTINPNPEYQSSPTVPVGSVIGTNPPAGASEPYGSKVTIIVSTGPATVTVPSVIGKTQAQATAILTGDKLKVAVVQVPVSQKSQNGKVQSTNPSAQSTEPQGTTVTISVGVYTAPTTTTTTTTTTPTTTTSTTS